MADRTLIIDGQVFQTDARDRGMGRYSARLIAAMLQHGDYQDVKVIFTSHKPANRLSTEMAQTLFPQATHVHLHLLDSASNRYEKAVEHNRTTLEEYIVSQNLVAEEVDFLIPSPFQEPVVSVYPQGVKKIVVFYDLIPYLYHTRYQTLMPYDNYLKRFNLLFAADHILAISNSVKDDLMVYLGIEGDRITAIDGGPIKSDAAPVRPAFDVPERYILMPTSDDPRKNNLRAVLGFEEFKASQEVNYRLVITSKIHESERRRLALFSKNLLFTGNIPESELDWLYHHCDGVLFVPESEGLGLPILEAALAHKRVVCSNLNVFREISANNAFYFCDYENQHSIAAALTRAFSEGDRDINESEYSRILSHYSWEATGKRALSAVRKAASRQVISTSRKPRIAVFTPRPDGLSAIGKVVAELHPTLSKYFEIDYYIERGAYVGSTRPDYLRYIANCYGAETFGIEKYRQYDAAVYHIGNSDYHLESIANSLYLPGVVIIHDTNLDAAYGVMVKTGRISESRAEAEKRLSEDDKLSMSSGLVSIATRQLGIMTHSLFSQEAIAEIDPALVKLSSVVNLASAAPSAVVQKEDRPFTVGLAGILADIKGIEVIESIAKDRRFNDIQIELFGFNFTTTNTMRRLQEYPNINIATNLTDFDFTNSISKLNVFVNYRMKYQGETSLSTIEAMRQGVVVIVRNIGWYAELPDDAVVKVDSEDEVKGALEKIIANPEYAEGIGARAHAHIAQNFTHDAYARAILGVVRHKRRAVMNSYARSIQVNAPRRAQSLLDLYRKMKP